MLLHYTWQQKQTWGGTSKSFMYFWFPFLKNNIEKGTQLLTGTIKIKSELILHPKAMAESSFSLL